MAPNSPESSQVLQFPTSDSTPVLDLNTLIMRSNPRRLPEEAGSSLEDSSYELLGESTYSISDDEGNTASLASTDHTPDNGSTFSEDDDDDDFERYAHESSQQIEQPPTYREVESPYSYADAIRSGEDSTLTEVPPHLDESESSRLIKLNEQVIDDDDTIQAWRHIRVYDQEVDMPDVLKPYECPKIRLTVRAALSERHMPVSGVFRILYIGDYQEWAEKDISSQIGAALSASPGPSRSIMVGGQMEPYGPVIDVHRCTALETLGGEIGKPSEVKLTIDDMHCTQFTFGPKKAFHIQGPTAFPDLVIFCYGTASSFVTEVERFRAVREAFRRRQIPYLDIAQVRPWNSLGSTAYDLKSLRLCVEGRRDESSEFELEEVLPIDHYTFCQLDPAQLNRHLAHITPATSSNNDARNQSLNNYLPQRLNKVIASWPSTGKFSVMVLILTAMLSIFFLRPGLSTVLPNTAFPVAAEPITSPTVSVSKANLASSITAADAVYTSMLSALHVDSLARKDLTAVITRDVASGTPKKAAEEGKASGFDIQSTGDHQFVLSPSKDFVNRKRKPQLQIHVSHNSKAVPVRYIRTIGGVYVVDLEQEHPRSSFNVSIATHSKPLLQQSFKITLGYNKSRFNQILDTIKHDIMSAKDHLWNVSSAVSQEFQHRCVGWEQGNNIWKEKKATRLNTKQVFADQVQAFARATQIHLRASGFLLKETQRATWMGFRKATAPIRTSNAVLRARTNALRLRCKLEKAAGFADKDNSDKETTWACSKVKTLR